ncbi:MAG: hypothetical protein ACRD2C_12425 [Acidimicrobiales bacterium]
MIDEQDLDALGQPDAGPTVTCRPVDEVLARGAHLRRRRHALRSAGVAAVAACMVGAGVLVVDHQSDPAATDVSAGRDPTVPSTEDVPSDPPPPPPECVASWSSMVESALVEAEGTDPRMTPSDVPDELRYLPTWIPDGEEITLAQGESWGDICPEALVQPADDALALWADGGDGVVDATITVSGPLPWPIFDATATGANEMAPVGSERSASIRGREATFGGIDADFQFEWTEADGWTWGLRGVGVDEATLRAVGEALVLDSSPEGDEPAAALGDVDLPSGFEVVWQREGVATPLRDSEVTWRVAIGDSTTMQGTRCELEVSPRIGDAPIASYGGVGSRAATVNGQPAMWGPWLSYTVDQVGVLTWEISPGIVARTGCASLGEGMPQSLPLEDVVRLAESVEAIAADDPRLPG